MKSIFERLAHLENRINMLERDNIALREIIGEPHEENPLDYEAIARKYSSPSLVSTEDGAA